MYLNKRLPIPPPCQIAPAVYRGATLKKGGLNPAKLWSGQEFNPSMLLLRNRSGRNAPNCPGASRALRLPNQMSFGALCRGAPCAAVKTALPGFVVSKRQMDVVPSPARRVVCPSATSVSTNRPHGPFAGNVQARRRLFLIKNLRVLCFEMPLEVCERPITARTNTVLNPVYYLCFRRFKRPNRVLFPQ